MRLLLELDDSQDTVRRISTAIEEQLKTSPRLKAGRQTPTRVYPLMLKTLSDRLCADDAIIIRYDRPGGWF